MNRIGAFLGLIVLLLSLFLFFGCEEDLPTCAEYCDHVEECSLMRHRMFSYSECRRECKEETQRLESVGCNVESQRYWKCLIELSCYEWENQTEYCSGEIGELSRCIEE